MEHEYIITLKVSAYHDFENRKEVEDWIWDEARPELAKLGFDVEDVHIQRRESR
jgi:hypothetical protein